MPVFQHSGLIPFSQTITVSLYVASTMVGPPYLISSASTSSSPGALLFLILFITLCISSHKEISTFLSSSSPSLLRSFDKPVSESSFLFRSSLKRSAHLPMIYFSSPINFPFLSLHSFTTGWYSFLSLSNALQNFLISLCWFSCSTSSNCLLKLHIAVCTVHLYRVIA